MISGLEENTDYLFCVHAKNSTGMSDEPCVTEKPTTTPKSTSKKPLMMLLNLYILYLYSLYTIYIMIKHGIGVVCSISAIGVYVL